jgi:GDP-L-fucose synthase
MNKDSKILVLGSRGLVGSALVRELKVQGFKNLLTPVRENLDLLRQQEVENYFESNKPEYVFMAAAKVGGIHANDTYRADFIFENLTIQNNVFGAAHKFTPKRLLFLGSSCIYPKNCPQPMKEEYLLTGELEQTNEPYAIAKIAGLKTAQAMRAQYGHDFISVMPTNLYGPNDNFHPENSHVIPGLIARMTEAKKNNDSVFKAWGTGNPRREFLYVDDMAKACMHVMNYEGRDLPDWMNIGTGEDISIKELVYMIKDIVGFEGEIEFDSSKPDGTMKKLLDVSKIGGLGWKASLDISTGLKRVEGIYEGR